MTPAEDVIYLLTCIKHGGLTPDYDAIAKDAGLKDRKAAYDRYRRLAKRYEEATAAGVGNGTALQTPGKKRGRKSTKEKEDPTDAAEDDNVKCEDPDSGVAESAKKKAKTEDSNGA